MHTSHYTKAAAIYHHIAILLVFFPIISSCSISGTTRPAHFYVLDATATPSAGELSGLRLGVGPILIPGYIDRPQIVTKSESAKLHYAEYERWAEPMDKMFTRILTQNITLATGSNNIISHPWSASANLNNELTAKIIKFENNINGDALLAVQWQLLNNSDRNQSSSVYSEFTARAESSDYSSQVTALNDTIKQFAHTVINHLASQSQ
tara:strand:+ start:94033 stop:94656 length:624 start_codon:yes stop_codon:yes gene_type:complete